MNISPKFISYINNSNKCSLHPELDKMVHNLSNNFINLPNIIIYGPNGTGRYTQALRIINKYSKSNLQYEKKVVCSTNKLDFYIKISDIHFEIDFSILGCNAKTIWDSIYKTIIDIITISVNKQGIFLCYNFQEIHRDLLPIFFSYMQSINNIIKFKFIIITDALGFIPDSITFRCQTIKVKRPTKKLYSNCIQLKIPQTISLKNIDNINTVRDKNYELLSPDIKQSKKIFEMILDSENLNIIDIRNELYNILTYNYQFDKILWNILILVLQLKNISIDKKRECIKFTLEIYKYYYNNYRPIYHLENFVFYLITVINGYQNSIKDTLYKL